VNIGVGLGEEGLLGGKRGIMPISSTTDADMMEPGEREGKASKA